MLEPCRLDHLLKGWFCHLLTRSPGAPQALRNPSSPVVESILPRLSTASPHLLARACTEGQAAWKILGGRKGKALPTLEVHAAGSLCLGASLSSSSLCPSTSTASSTDRLNDPALGRDGSPASMGGDGVKNKGTGRYWGSERDSRKTLAPP
ncbi:hypothetical protein Naga_100295g7, partial [Nannochloropsis gaditana]